MDTLKTIIENLKSSQSDSEKFAYLLILSKVIKPEDITDDEQDQLCDAISAKFIVRLLQVPESTPNSTHYKELAVSIMKCCFLRSSYSALIGDSIDKLLNAVQESNSTTLNEDVASILHYAKKYDIVEKSQLLCMILPFANKFCSSESYEIWCVLVADLYSNETKSIGELIKYLIEKLVQTSKPPSPSLEQTLLLVDSISRLISCKDHLYREIQNFDSFKVVICNLIKSKLSLKNKVQLLNICPFLSSIYSCSSWEGTMICYRHCCIELKLVLEEVVHQHEESESTELSEMHLKCVVSCCSTLENAINELVDENNVISGEDLQALIDGIRMSMKSAMFYLQKQLFVHSCYSSVYRLFMRWSSDDSFDIDETITTFRSLTDFFNDSNNYKVYGSFMTSAVINQMDNEEFRKFVSNEYGQFLLQTTIKNWKYEFVFAPIFNDALAHKITVNPGHIFQAKEDCLKNLFHHEANKFTFYNLALIQVVVYIILSAKRHKLQLSDLCTPFSLEHWLTKSINYLLKPLQSPEPPHSWCDLREVWLSSVNSLCVCLVSSDVKLDMNLDFLTAKSANYSESCDEVAGALGDLLAAIIN